jgi:hypothetical protein
MMDLLSRMSLLTLKSSETEVKTFDLFPEAPQILQGAPQISAPCKRICLTRLVKQLSRPSTPR